MIDRILDYKSYPKMVSGVSACANYGETTHKNGTQTIMTRMVIGAAMVKSECQEGDVVVGERGSDNVPRVARAPASPPPLPATVEYFIHHTYYPDLSSITWTLDYTRESQLDESVGFWYIEAHPDRPDHTRVFYSVNVLLGSWVPVSAGSGHRTQVETRQPPLTPSTPSSTHRASSWT